MTIESTVWYSEVSEQLETVLVEKNNSQPTIQQLAEADELWAAKDAEADLPYIIQIED